MGIFFIRLAAEEQGPTARWRRSAGSTTPTGVYVVRVCVQFNNFVLHKYLDLDAQFFIFAFDLFFVRRTL